VFEQFGSSLVGIYTWVLLRENVVGQFDDRTPDVVLVSLYNARIGGQLFGAAEKNWIAGRTAHVASRMIRFRQTLEVLWVGSVPHAHGVQRGFAVEGRAIA
jgi:hypothetical protein